MDIAQYYAKSQNLAVTYTPCSTVSKMRRRGMGKNLFLRPVATVWFDTGGSRVTAYP